MKISTLIKFVCISFFIISCEGEFVQNSTAIIELIGPDGLCEKGIEQPQNRLEIEFTWSKSNNGNFQSYRIEIEDLQSEETVISEIVDGDSLTKLITLERGKNYDWQVYGISMDNEQEVVSDKMNFYSESIPENNLSPLPVIISVSKPTTASARISWTISDREVLDNLEFDVFFGVEENPQEQLENTKVQPEPILKENLENGEYFIKIVATKKVLNDVYSTSSFKKLSISGN